MKVQVQPSLCPNLFRNSLTIMNLAPDVIIPNEVMVNRQTSGDASYASILSNGPLTRYVKLLFAHAPGMPGTFSPTADFEGNR